MARKGGAAGKDNGKTIVIRREEAVDDGRHGGAWKVAYADFVTAMMAFFLLMWLLSTTSEDQRKGLADYFSPTSLLSRAASGTGKPFSGSTPLVDGSLLSDRGALQVITGEQPVVDLPDEDSDTRAEPRPYRDDITPTQEQPQDQQTATAVAARTADTGPTPGQPVSSSHPSTFPPDAHVATATRPQPPRPPTAEEIRAERERQERQAFEQAAEQIRDAVRADPTFADIASQLAIDMTPEGLRIQIMDEDRRPMFATGSALPNEWARLLLQKVAPVLQHLPQPISIAGHTDAAPYRGTDRSNWELSTERANATRRALLEAGMPEARVRTVTGHADRDPLLPADPLAAANRRIAIVVLRTVHAGPAGPALPGPPDSR